MKRDWTPARAKVEAEGRCRGCDRPMRPERLEAAHLWGRERDPHAPVGWDLANPLDRWSEPYLVVADRIVPMCRRCHQEVYDGPASDRGELGMGAKLTPAEAVQLVADAGSIAQAWLRLTGERVP